VKTANTNRRDNLTGLFRRGTGLARSRILADAGSCARILADAGFVRAHRTGQFTYYKRNDAELRKPRRTLAPISERTLDPQTCATPLSHPF
jgi:hypothetical protein